MRTDFNKFQENQVLLLKDGTFVMITGVDPATKINNSEKTRRCYCKLGHKYKKNEQFKEKGKFICVFENEPEGQIISIDCSQMKTYTIEELRKLVAIEIGIVTEEKMKDFNRISAEFSKTQDW